MGLNWGAGLTAFGKGLEGVQAAKEKTAELEYRNMRDQNLRRFDLEDREYKAGREDAATAAAAIETARTEAREDEGLGIVPESERGSAIIEKQKGDAESKHSQEMEKIYARNKGKGAKGAQGKTREEYIAEEMDKYNKAWTENVDMTKPNEDGTPRRMSKRDRDWLISTIGQDYDAIYGKGTQVVGSPVAAEEEAPTPFDQESDPTAVLEAARDAINRGADPEQVKQRLIDNGIDPTGL